MRLIAENVESLSKKKGPNRSIISTCSSTTCDLGESFVMTVALFEFGLFKSSEDLGVE